MSQLFLTGLMFLHPYKFSLIGVLTLVLVSLTPSPSVASSCTGFAGGDGSAGDPYQITSVSEFKALENCQQASDFKIMNDIDFGGTEPGAGISDFVGTLDGNGKTLTDLKIDSKSSGSLVGVFEQVSGGEISDLTVSGLHILQAGSLDYSGFIGEASGNFRLSDLSLKNVQQDSESAFTGGLIGIAKLSSSATIEKIEIETTLKCSKSSSSCGGLIGYAQAVSAGALISGVFVETNFSSMGDTNVSNQGGLVGIVRGDGGKTTDLKIQDAVVSLTNSEPSAGGRFGGVVGFVINSFANSSIELILDRVSVAGVLPEAVDRAALLGAINEGGSGLDSIFTVEEVLVAVDFSAPESKTALAYGGALGNPGNSSDAVYNKNNAEIYHDTQSTNDTDPVAKIMTADKSKLSTYSNRFTITNNLAATGADWYVQEPDTVGTSNGTGSDGYIGSIFDGYPVPFAVANAGFLGNRFNFQKNDGSAEVVRRIGYANDGGGIDVISNPFTRADHVFDGWTNAQTQGDPYAIGEAINGFDNANIYAQWLELFDVSFEFSSADSGSVASQLDKTSITVPGKGNLLRSGYEFAGWQDADGNAYAAAQTVSLSKDLVLTAQWTEVPSTTATPYTGPVISSVGTSNDFTSASGNTVTITGSRLATVTKATINGLDAEIVSTSSDSFQIIIPEGLTPGTYDLMIESSLGNLTYLDGITITSETSTAPEDSPVSYGEMTAWTKKINDNQVKVYVKFPTVGEKVRISHQTGDSGSYETIYVKTTSSETMDGLRIVEGVGTYIVRTINLADINRIRVTVGDETPVQVRYNR